MSMSCVKAPSYFSSFGTTATVFDGEPAPNVPPVAPLMVAAILAAMAARGRPQRQCKDIHESVVGTHQPALLHRFRPKLARCSPRRPTCVWKTSQVVVSGLSEVRNR